MNIYFPLLFSIMALFFLFIGVTVVLNKKPIFLSSKYFFGFMVLAISPQFVNAAIMLTNDMSENLSLVLYLNPIVLVALLVFFWFQMKGYMAIGISDDSFREALHYSLNKNNLPFEEQLSTVKLTSINASLQIAIQSWVGAGQIKLKETKNINVLPEIVGGINEYYSDNSIKPNNVTSIFYIFMGVFMLIFAGAFYFIFP